MGDGLTDLRYTERLERPALVRFPADGRTDLLYAQSTHYSSVTSRRAG